jgi:hypothetical protein
MRSPDDRLAVNVGGRRNAPRLLGSLRSLPLAAVASGNRPRYPSLQRRFDLHLLVIDDRDDFGIPLCDRRSI